MAGLLIAGTTSDAGKSTVTAGLCRAFARRGVRVAPFKAQNMSNNSMVVRAADGTLGEIGRAQWIQARAARAIPEPAMNPVLLKPGSDIGTHAVVMGQPAGTVSSANWRADRAPWAAIAHEAFDDLSGRYDVVIAEGAGSPTEINLRDSDYVNMGLAQHASLPTVVVGDIDRGGVFAALYGTLALLDAADQALVTGFIINKFRGDASLLAPGLDSLEQLTRRRVYGVLPWHPQVWLDSEDTLDVPAASADAETATRRVAVIRLPRISNFTDVDALRLEPGLDVHFASSPAGLADADLVVIPGSRATVADLAWLRQRGLDRAIVRHADDGGAVLGICGGYQMLGALISDPAGVESPTQQVAGLGLLDVRTQFGADKTLSLCHGTALDAPVEGYEIHHGRVDVSDGEPFPGGVRQGRVIGTLWHGLFESDAFRAAFLRDVLGARPSDVSFADARERRLDLLADLVEKYLPVDDLLQLARDGAPDGLRAVPPARS
ncbi:adenosylcobyric acid synthase (glutamine-hydrolysing) [Branchiibius hedensis]|uniref:Cobyric acid synthase n=1 Tax=Branchiibius hedensis TaxID=672460 RepID=A0A2Y9C102_9MICO|nr:cobyric acid synthase [Branchiibius hedensis]PWJ24606.1 adenosylcobyric acid synthase (glutamine-hydrolysing) [Branchiibius hedensis]SSA33423.1 adenosylcobyric acid synthase (glutamine-hydrolysing) [Branchiibius hedensis]